MRASLAALVLAAIVTASASAAPSSSTSLRITFWKDSSKPLDRWSWTLRCSPTGGSLPRPARACTRLLAGGVKLFAPVAKNAVCTEIYGGPQQAHVVGTVKGRLVRATFSRTNGCEVARWQRVSPWLVPPGGVTS
jgi:Subtilisin inhibitor-like